MVARKRLPAYKVREHVSGTSLGIDPRESEADRKECAGCGVLRRSVDESGLCGFCRAPSGGVRGRAVPGEDG